MGNLKEHEMHFIYERTIKTTINNCKRVAPNARRRDSRNGLTAKPQNSSCSYSNIISCMYVWATGCQLIMLRVAISAIIRYILLEIEMRIKDNKFVGGLEQCFLQQIPLQVYGREKVQAISA
jgi:hypothetical protein